MLNRRAIHFNVLTVSRRIRTAIFKTKIDFRRSPRFVKRLHVHFNEPIVSRFRSTWLRVVMPGIAAAT